MNSCEVGTGAIFTGSQLGRHRFGRKFLPHLFPGRLHLEDVVAADLNKIADELALSFDLRQEIRGLTEESPLTKNPIGVSGSGSKIE